MSRLPHGPDPVDAYVGLRIRARRHELGLSQEALAAALGLSFQQVQKYERGGNRVSASRLVHIAKALETTPGWFFIGLPAITADDTAQDPLAEWLASPEGMEWTRAGHALDGAGYAAVLQVARVLLGRPMRTAEIKPFYGRKAS